MVEWKKLGEICDIGTGSNNREDACDNGCYPFYVRSQEVLRINSYLYDEEAILIPGEGAIGDIFHYVNGKYGLHQRTYRVHPITNSVKGRYIYYFLFANFKTYINAKSYKSTAASIRKPMLLDFPIIIPSLEEQTRIVGILDTFTSAIDNLKEQIAQRRKQYEHYRDQLLDYSKDSCVVWKPLECAYPFIRNGFVGTVTPFFTNKNNGVRYLEGTNIHNGKISDNTLLYVTQDFHQKHKKSELKADDILMVQSGHIGECAIVGNKYEGANCHALIIMSNGGFCNSKFIVYYFHTSKGLKSLSPAITGGAIKHVLAKKVGKILIPIPSLEEQSRIVSILDTFEASISNLGAQLKEREKQYEYYRNKLLTFEKAE